LVHLFSVELCGPADFIRKYALSQVVWQVPVLMRWAAGYYHGWLR
jgi:hypothetical protein